MTTAIAQEVCVLRFIVRRLIQMVAVLAVLSLLLFMWLKSLPGGTVSAMLGERATPQSRAALEKVLGLDQPLWSQYLSFVGRILKGDFGVSNGVLQGRDALDIFLQRLPATIELSTFAMILAVALGIPLGYLAARRHGSFLDNLSVITSLVGVAVPVFFLAFLLKYIFAIKLGWLPVSGRQDSELGATRVTGFFVFDGLITREFDAAWDAFKHLILPAVALSSIPFAVIFRITRAAVLDVVGEDYIRTAESKGLTNRIIRGRHILRNAMLPGDDDDRSPDRRAPGRRRPHRASLRLRGRRQRLGRGLHQARLPRPPGLDSGGRRDLRHRQPVGRHRLRGHRPPSQDEVT